MTKIYKTDCDGVTIRYRFLNEGTHLYFQRITEMPETEEYDIGFSEEEFRRLREKNTISVKDEYLEYHSLIEKTAHYLMRYDRCLFHGAAVVYNGYAWLLSGPSGTGKTTQLINWIKMYPEEIKVINGDKPVLRFQEDKGIEVCTSPWRGKERFGLEMSAPLGGIIYLEQGKENEFVGKEETEKTGMILWQFLMRPDTEEEVRKLAGYLDRIFREVPVYVYRNKGDFESTEKLRNRIIECGKKCQSV